MIKMEQRKILSISKDKIKSIHYDLIDSGFSFGIREHPVRQMESLGIHLIAAIPETIADCWCCLTDYQGELPGYIHIAELEPGNEYWKHWGYDIIE